MNSLLVTFSRFLYRAIYKNPNRVQEDWGLYLNGDKVPVINDVIANTAERRGNDVIDHGYYDVVDQGYYDDIDPEAQVGGLRGEIGPPALGSLNHVNTAELAIGEDEFN